MARSTKSGPPKTPETPEETLTPPEVENSGLPEPDPALVAAPEPVVASTEDSPPSPAEPEPLPEPAPVARPEPTAPPRIDPPPLPRSQPQRQSFLPLLLGGVLAGGIGFAAAWAVQQREADAGATATAAALTEQAARITALESAPLPAPPDLTPVQDAIAQATAATQDLSVALTDQVARIDTTLSALDGQLAALDTRLTTLERAPAPDGSLSEAAITSWQAEIAAMQEMVATLQTDLAAATAAADARIAAAEAALAAQIADLQGAADAQLTETAAELQARLDAAEAAAAEEQASAADMAALATQRAAMTRLLAALDAGTPFDAALGELSAAGITPPEALTATAPAGVATMSSLLDSFPDAARAALATARAEGLTPEGGGFFGFLRNQLDVRSVTPREGSDPDAILSRAEAALRDGRLTDALAEVATLPEVVRADMSGWTAAAEARQDAIAAAQALSESLNLN